jgi:hypothetical protein
MVVRLKGGPEDMLRFEMLENGNFFAGLSAPSPVQATVIGTLTGTEIDALARDVYLDFPGIWDLIPMEEEVVRITGGFITGDTRITGALTDPEFSGSAWGSGVRLRVPRFIPEEIGPGSGAITLAGNEIAFGPIEALCGGGRGEITAGFRFNRWIPSFNMAITVDGEAFIPFNFDLAGIVAHGNISGNLDLNMENNEILTLTGNLDVSDTEITLNRDELEKINEGGFVESSLEIIANVHISAGRRVEFLWPSTNFPIIQAYGDAGTGIQVVGDTRIPQFTLSGDLTLRGGEIFYYQRNFYIREGQIFFSSTDTRLDPRISVRAEIRDRNDDGLVTIAMIVDNAPLSSFMPRFESTPPLSQLEIYSLLGQSPMGATISEEQTNTVLIEAATDVFAQFAVVRQTERRIRNILGLDMFSVRTQALQNAVFQVLGTQDPVEQNRSVVGNFFDNTTVFVGKYLGSDLFFQAMVSLRYDEYRADFAGLRIEPDIGIDFRTPIVNIQWNLSPRHPENLFVNDQSVSLVWRWVF